MRFSVTSITCLAILAAAPAAAQEPSTVPGSRMFAAAHRQVWDAVTAELKSLGLKLESSDPETGVFVTRSYTFSSSGRFPRPTLPDPMLHAERIVLHGFVSPFSAPARVYVTSFVFATSAHGPPGQVMRLQGTGAEEPLLARVSSRLGLAGEPVFRNRELRMQQALRLLGKPDQCLSRPDTSQFNGFLGMLRALNDVKTDYPIDMRTAAKEGHVWIEAEISEDGAVVGALIVTADGQRRQPQTSFEVSVAQMMWLTRFEPPVLQGCHVGLFHKRQVTFSMK